MTRANTSTRRSSGEVTHSSLGHHGEGVNRYHVLSVAVYCPSCGQAACWIERDWDPEEEPEPTWTDVRAVMLRKGDVTPAGAITDIELFGDLLRVSFDVEDGRSFTRTFDDLVSVRR